MTDATKAVNPPGNRRAPAELWTRTALRNRGWSKRLIDLLLGEPDQITRNMRYGEASALIRLYIADCVREAEGHPDFIAYQASRSRRAAATRAAAKRRSIATLRTIEMVPIEVLRLPIEHVMQASAERWARRQRDRSNPGCDAENAPLVVRQCWAVDYVRRELTDYDEHLVERVAQRIGAAKAARRLRGRILDAIAEAYPDLAAEARRQHAVHCP